MGVNYSGDSNKDSLSRINPLQARFNSMSKNVIVTAIVAFVLGVGLTYAFTTNFSKQKEQRIINPPITTVQPSQALNSLTVPASGSLRKSCQVNSECFLTTLADCMSDRYNCGIPDYASDSVEAFNNRLCVQKDPDAPVPGCMVQSINEDKYDAQCINGTCRKVLKQKHNTSTQGITCASSADCPA